MFRVLILGDGNFSFTLALAQLLFPIRLAKAPRLSTTKETHAKTIAAEEASKEEETRAAQERKKAVYAYLGLPFRETAPHEGRTEEEEEEEAWSILSTSFDSEEEVLEKYPESRKILTQLQRFAPDGLTVRHNVNAWELAQLRLTLGGTAFDCVCWNHPHLGTEDARLHRFLMAHFFHSTREILNVSHPHASVVVTLLSGQETRWSLDATAIEAADYVPLPRVFFNETAFPGYICKRNKNSQSFKNSTTRHDVALNGFKEMPSYLYRFVVRDAKHLEGVSGNTIATPEATRTEQIQCQRCDRHFLDRPGLMLHMRAKHWHQPTDSAPSDELFHHDTSGGSVLTNLNATHPCTECPKTFKDEEALRQHQINKHTTLAPGELPAIGNAGQGGTDGGWRVDPAVFLRPSAQSLQQDHIDTNAASPSETSEGAYTYVPCPICAQAIPSTASGYALHLETLKPLLGQKMHCPLCVHAQDTALQKGPSAFPRRAAYLKAKEGNRPFNEERALVQHYRFCRAKQQQSVSASPEAIR